MTTAQILDFYTRPAEMNSPGKHLPLFKDLPDSVNELSRMIQGLAIHEYAASDFYGVKIPDERKSESHIRSLEKMLDRIFELDSSALNVARSPDRRLNGVCHHFMLLMVGMLRAKGIPARARCGFGSYFNAGYFEDHWVCEYWNQDKRRWCLADPQFDDVWKSKLHIDHDVLDVPRDRFLVAADAWKKCRSGDEDSMKFGIFVGNLRGLWFIAGDLVHDVAALNNMEMLPWDSWGAISQPDEQLTENQIAFFDHLAAITHSPDASFPELRAIYENDERVRVPPVVFNALLKKTETIAS